MELLISQLIEYAVRKNWIRDEDRVWASNRILEIMEADGFGGLTAVSDLPDLREILSGLCRIAYENGTIEGNTPVYTDLFDTKLMGALVPRPSEIIDTFQRLYDEDPEAATNWYYEFSGDTDYIRRDRIAKDLKWTTDTEYGVLDITVNLSKPEKDPKAIAAAGLAKASGYPKCLLCAENEGYAGTLRHPARQNHRIIPVSLNGNDYFLQYSPYVYYNEHCIVFNREHTPMLINRNTFDNLLDFITKFPHYFIGSNADLPIVGGSVLSHDHYQGGKYEFPMAKAGADITFTIPGFADVEAETVVWPMSVIRIRCNDRKRLADAADHILKSWIDYSDESANIISHTDGIRHNTITPIARRRGAAYELDLVLRNNRTSSEHPMGTFHPHEEKHHIKKENIGLIEVMGLAVLPARLKTELSLLADAMVSGEDVSSDERISSHAGWACEVMQKHPELNAENAEEILREETGSVFKTVLEDAGVFKRDAEGVKAFRRFIDML